MKDSGSGLSDDATLALEFLSHTGEVDDEIGLARLCGWDANESLVQPRSKAVIGELSSAGLLARDGDKWSLTAEGRSRADAARASES